MNSQIFLFNLSMKKVLLIIHFLMLNCIILFAQSPYKYFKISEEKFVYEKVFEVDSLSASQIDSLLIQYLPTATSIQNIKSNNGLITANFVNLFNNHATWKVYPLNANIIIKIKNGKYMVIVNSIVFSTIAPVFGMNQMIAQSVPAETYFLKHSPAEYRTRGDLQGLAVILENQLTDIFTIKKTKDDW
jgi:hypothetical protein